MQTKLLNAKYDCFEAVSNENIECSIDIEYSLPDYCPDIQKILKCIPSTEICSYSITQDKLMCEGKLTLYVQYLDEKSDTIRVCEITKEFTVARDIKNYGDKTIGRLLSSTGHIICRAISARKLDIHIPVIVNLSQNALKQNNINYESDDLEKKTESVDISHAVMSINQQFLIEKELNLPQSLMPIDSIIRKNIEINSIKCECSSDKIQVDGQAEVCVVYRSFSDNSATEKVSFTIPFTQNFETELGDYNYNLCCDIDSLEFTVQPKEDGVGEYTICQLYLKLNAIIYVYEEKQLDIIVDAYSVKTPSKIKYENINFYHLVSNHTEKNTYTKNIFLAEDEVESVIDCWCEDISVTPYCEKNRINYRGKFNIALSYVGKSKKIYSVTKNFDFSTTREFPNSVQRRCEAQAKVNITNFRIMDGNNIEFSIEAILHSIDFEIISKSILSSVEFTDNIESAEKNSIKVYYSQKGEQLWEIGKKFACSVYEIAELNELVDTVNSPGGPLVIY